MVCGTALWAAVVLAVVGAIAGTTASRLIQYGIVGIAVGGVASLVTVHSFLEAAMRPARVTIAGDLAISDCLPGSRPTFAA